MEHSFGRAAPFALGVEEELLLLDPGSGMLAHSSSRLVPRVERAGRHGHARRLRGARRDRLADQPQRDRGRALARAAARRDPRRRRDARRRRHPPRERVRRRAARRQRALPRDRRADARAAAPHADLRAAHPRRHARPRDRDPRLQPHAPAPARRCRRSPPTRPTGTGSTRASRPRAPRCSAATRAPTSRARSPAGTTTRPRWTRSSPPPASRTTRSSGGTCARTRSSARSRCARWTPRRASARCAGSPRSSTGSCSPPRTSRRQPRRSRARCSSSRRFRAGRDGLAATVWHDGALRPVTERIAAALELARPYARDVGAEPALEEIERIVREGNGADRMRAAHAEGGMPRVLHRLITESAASAGERCMTRRGDGDRRRRAAEHEQDRPADRSGPSSPRRRARC